MELTDSQAAALENEDKPGVNSVEGRWHSRDKGNSISNGRDKKWDTETSRSRKIARKFRILVQELQRPISGSTW